MEDGVDRPRYRHMLEHKRGQEGEFACVEKKNIYHQFICSGVII